MKKVSKYLDELSILIAFFTCFFCGFFSCNFNTVRASSIQLALVRDAAVSDYDWIMGEISIEKSNFASCRQFLLETEASHQFISRPTFISFVGIDNNNISLEQNDTRYGSATVINLSQVCMPYDSFGYLYGLPVTPVFTDNYCDWNIYSNLGESSYISLDFALQLLSKNPELLELKDLLGLTYNVKCGDISVKHVIANILRYDNLEGTFLKKRYGNIIVSASNELFYSNSVFLNTSFASDILSCRDCYKILANQSLEKASFEVCKNGEWEKTAASNEYENLVLKRTNFSVLSFVLFGLLFLLFNSMFVLAILLFGASIKKKYFLIIPFVLFLILITSVNSTSNNVLFLCFFNPLLSIVCILNILFVVMFFFIRNKRKINYE